jgi:hypothetical protein
MEMSEKGMAEGLAKLDAEMQRRARAADQAWKAAAVTVAGKVLDRIEPTIPVRTGELAGSGFIARDGSGEFGWGSAHAETVHELDHGRGFKFHQRGVAEAAGDVPRMMAELHDAYTAEGMTPSSAPASWPATPVTRAGPPSARRRRPVERARAAPRHRR